MADYIERRNALSDEPCVGTSCQDCPFCSDNIFGGCKMANFINSIPAADVAPVRRGRWARKSNGIEWWLECSKCEYFTYNSNGWHYCPNCGAKMITEEVSE